MRTVNLFIATPCYGGNLTSRYVLSLLGTQSLLIQNGIGYSVYFHTDSLITRARNSIASHFLRQRVFTHLLFVDADLAFDPSIVLRFLDFDKEVVGGVYPVKQLDIGAIRRSAIADDRVAEAVSYNYSSSIYLHENNMPENGFIRVNYAATGFLMIKREVLERMVEAYPGLRYQDDFTRLDPIPAYALFDTMIEEGRFLPEDYAFCKRWRDLGGEIWADVASKFAHIGSYIYSGDIAAAVTDAMTPVP